jgi:hypothetical protein
LKLKDAASGREITFELLRFLIPQEQFEVITEMNKDGCLCFAYPDCHFEDSSRNTTIN